MVNQATLADEIANSRPVSRRRDGAGMRDGSSGQVGELDPQIDDELTLDIGG